MRVGGAGVFLGLFGFGVRRDLFTSWLDVGIVSLGFTSPVSRARIEEVAERARKIKDAVPRLTKAVHK